MKNEVLKNFFKEYKRYLVETNHTYNVSDQYCTYLRKACALLNLGEGFIEAIIAISDVNVQAALCEYLIRTYSNEGDVVLDNCMGSGTTGVGCVNLNRQFIGIEMEEKFFDISVNRILNRESVE